MSLPTCNPCAEVPECFEGLDKYSLQDDLYGYVFNCPPNVYCGGPQTLYLACCEGTSMQQTFPQGISTARRRALINELVARCERRLLFCEPYNPKEPPPLPPDTDSDYFYSAPASCTVYCPDGTPFTYTVPAGTFISRNLADAQAAAKQLACLRAPMYRICLEDWQICCCAGVVVNGRIAIISDNPPFKVSVVVGALPPGIAVTTLGNLVVISGAPSTNGTYTFTLRVTDAFGNSTTHAYRMVVIQITTLSLPSYTIGDPYSYQMTAAGGSGNYAWTITSGTLPDGLGMDVNGLISGTPTGLGGGGSITFRVVDTNCEQATQAFFRPRIALSGISNTVIKIFRGWPKWTGYDGILYKVATFSGTVTQIAYPNYNDPVTDAIQCAGAKYIFSGYDEIDAFGRELNSHVRDLYSMCNATPPALFSLIITGGVARPVSSPTLSVLLGYCWATDPLSCGSCTNDPATWAFTDDRAEFGAYDFPTQMVTLNNTSLSPLVKTVSGLNFISTSTNIERRDTFPINSGYNVYEDAWPFVQVIVDGSFEVTLSDEFTDADANTGAIRYTSNSLVAENKPDYINYTKDTFVNVGDRITSVTYRLSCTNLAIGSNYIARVQLRDSSGATTTVSIPFTATSRTHLVTGSIPTPIANHTIKALNPSIVFVP